MSRKKYRSIACAIALATSFAAVQGPVYADAAAPVAGDSKTAAEAAAVAANSAGGTTVAQSSEAAQWNASRPDDKTVVDQVKAYEGKTIECERQGRH